MWDTPTQHISRDSKHEVFEKTLALYTALLVRGCSVSEDTHVDSSDPLDNMLQDLPPDAGDWVSLAAPNGTGLPLDTRAKATTACGGGFVLHWNSDGRPHLQ
jgi:hypothetical protein